MAGRIPSSVRESSRDHASSMTPRSRVSPVPPVFPVVDPGDHIDPLAQMNASMFCCSRAWNSRRNRELSSRPRCTSRHFFRASSAVCAVYSTRCGPGTGTACPNTCRDHSASCASNPTHRCVITGSSSSVFPVACRGPITITSEYASSPVSGSISNATSKISAWCGIGGLPSLAATSATRGPSVGRSGLRGVPYRG
jgi:hypothetical protein